MLLSIASVIIAGTDLMIQIVQASPTGIALGHALFALAICLVGIVLSVTWSGHLLAKSVSPTMQQQAAIDSAEERPFLFAIKDGADSGRGFMANTDNIADNGRHGQPMPLYSAEEVLIRRAAPGVPIASDPLFSFAQPTAGERCFVLAREGEPLVECQDRYALNAAKRVYAIADGVSGSFLPGPWASIIAQGFVDRFEALGEKEAFSHWLYDCCASWNAWMQQHWVPAMNWQRQLQGEQPGDWSEEIAKGAQTTLTGCAIGPLNGAGLIEI
jgi:hypothetical protein